MDVLHIGIDLTAKYGGIYSSVRAFTEAFREQGYCPRVVNFGEANEPISGLSCSCTHVGVTRIPVLRQYRFWDGFWSAKFGRLAGTPDAVFIHGGFYHAAAAGAAYFRKRRIPYFFVSHGSLDPYVFTYRSLRKRTWTTLYRKRLLVDSEAVIFSTAEEARRAAAWTNGSRTEVILFPTPYAPDYDKPRARAALLKRFGLSPDLRVILYCGRVDSVKRPVETIHAFKAAGNDGWALILVGPANDPALVAAVEDACSRSGPRTIYAGAAYGNSLRAFFCGADLFVLLSHKENHSHVTAEALAHGVPALLSDRVNLWHELEPARCVWTVSDETIERGAAHEDFARVLALPRDEFGAAGDRGREWVRMKLSPEVFRAKLCGLLERVIRRQGGLAACES